MGALPLSVADVITAKKESLMKASVSSVPEFHAERFKTKATPVVRARHIMSVKFFLHVLQSPLQCGGRIKGSRLL